MLELITHDKGHLTTLHRMRRGRHLLKLPTTRSLNERLRHLKVILAGKLPLLLAERPNHADSILGLRLRRSHNLHEGHAHGLSAHAEWLMTIKPVKSAGAEQLKQAQGSSERRFPRPLAQPPDPLPVHE